MEGKFTKLALYGSNNECARTDNVFSPTSEVCDGTVSLIKNGILWKSLRDRGSMGNVVPWVIPRQKKPWACGFLGFWSCNSLGATFKTLPRRLFQRMYQYYILV